MPAHWCRGMNDSLGIAGADVARRVIVKGCGRCCYRPVLAKAGLYVHARIFIVGCSLQSDLWIFRMGCRIRCQALEPGLGCRAACRTEVCGIFGSDHSDPVCGFASAPVAHRAARRQWGVSKEGRGDVPRNVGVRLCDLPCGETRV